MWTSIIIHAVGVRSGIGFGDSNFIRAEGALQGRASSFRGWMERGFLLCQSGTLEFVAKVVKVFRADLHLQDFFDHRREYASERIVLRGAAPAGRIMRRSAARTSAFSTDASGIPRSYNWTASTRSGRRTAPEVPGVTRYASSNRRT
jgi:hypothetical protein